MFSKKEFFSQWKNLIHPQSNTEIVKNLGLAHSKMKVRLLMDVTTLFKVKYVLSLN